MTTDRVAQLPLYWKLVERLLQLYIGLSCVKDERHPAGCPKREQVVK
jgi:hypothetical protein